MTPPDGLLHELRSMLRHARALDRPVLEATIAELIRLDAAATPWVSPGDAVPEHMTRVLMALPRRGVSIGWYGHHDQRWRCRDVYCDAPTHWAVLPGVPE